MNTGFTGTQNGMTPQQKETVEKLLKEWKASEFHHGDCIGADANAHDIAKSLGVPIHIHPPTCEVKRAFCEGAFKVYPAKDYLERNHDIVDASDSMIATPKEESEQLRSGTWATIRYTRKCLKKLALVLPSGETKMEEGVNWSLFS